MLTHVNFPTFAMMGWYARQQDTYTYHTTGQLLYLDHKVGGNSYNNCFSYAMLKLQMEAQGMKMCWKL